MAFISCRNVSIEYEHFTAIEEISFDVEQGDYISIVGKNGAGKSTLIKAILGLVPFKSGEIIFDKKLQQNNIGYLPQRNTIQRDFPASVFEVVISGCLNHIGMKPFYSQIEKQTALNNLKKLGVLDLKGHSYQRLSGGQQQRILLARALCATDSLLILDEPGSGLDPIITADFDQLLKDLNRNSGITIIMVSHNIQNALANSNKILHIESSLQFFGSAKDYEFSPAGKGFLGGAPNA